MDADVAPARYAAPVALGDNESGGDRVSIPYPGDGARPSRETGGNDAARRGVAGASRMARRVSMRVGNGRKHERDEDGEA